MEGSWVVICSPVSGKKQGKQVVEDVLVPAWKRTLQTSLSVHYTEYHRHAVELAKQNSKATGIVVVGGDGTIHEVLEGLESAGQLGNVKLGLLSQGTMNFYAVTAGLPEAHSLPELVKSESFRPSSLLNVRDNTGALDSYSFEAFHIGSMAYNCCEAARIWRFRPGGVMVGIFSNLIFDNLFPSLRYYRGKLKIVRSDTKAQVTVEDDFFWVVASHRNPYTGCVGKQMWVSYMTLSGFPGFGRMMDFFKPPMEHYAGLGYCFQENIPCDSFSFCTESENLGCVLDGDSYLAGNKVWIEHVPSAFNVVAPKEFPTSIESKYIELETISPAASRWLNNNPPPQGTSLYKPKKKYDKEKQSPVIVKMMPVLLPVILLALAIYRFRKGLKFKPS